MADADNTMGISIITPDRVFYEGRALMVEFTTTEGEIGVYPRHIPLTTVLYPGVVTITVSEDEKKLAGIYAGFAEILGDKVTILAEAAEWPDEIDVDRAKEARDRAERRLKSSDANINMARAELALRKSLVRIELAEGDKK